MNRIPALASGFILFLSSAFAQPEAPDPERMERTTLLTGMDRPMEIEVAPDGRLFFIELGGRVSIHDPMTRQTLVVAELEVFAEQENGLLGIALDPAFQETGWIYLMYSPVDFPGQYISRFDFHNDRLDLASEKVLLSFEVQREECCHHAGSIEFGPNGDLFIPTGDNTHPGGDSDGYAPIDEREGRGPYDAQKSSSNTHDLRGKILRIVPTADGSYTIPEGNLFPLDGSQGRPEIYVMGCRNPWRIGIDQKTGTLYWGEVGPDAGGPGPRGPKGYDEINQARTAGNFGWPYLIANNLPYADYDLATKTVGELYDPEKPINRSPNNTGSVELPPAQPAFIYYPYGDEPAFPELGSGGRTACAGPVYHFDVSLESDVKFPGYYDNCLFIYEWTRHNIKAVFLDEEERIQRIEDFLPNIPMQRPIDLCFGPDGALYLLEYGESWGANPDSKLVQIAYAGDNRRPHALATADVLVGRHPLTVKFSSEGSYDVDEGDELHYAWFFDLNTEVQSREPHPTYTFEKPGVYPARLEVSDSDGRKNHVEMTIRVGNEPPQLSLSAPDIFQWGEPISYEVEIEDPEDGTTKAGTILPQEIVVETVFLEEAPAEIGEGKLDLQQKEHIGLTFMKGSNCFACHSASQAVVGPSFLAIGEKYAQEEGAVDLLADRVIKGSSGIWGPVPMLPHPELNTDQAREMIQWVIGLQTAKDSFANGSKGTFQTKTEGKPGGAYIIRASYTDHGAEGAARLSAEAVQVVRSQAINSTLSPE